MVADPLRFADKAYYADSAPPRPASRIEGSRTHRTQPRPPVQEVVRTADRAYYAEGVERVAIDAPLPVTIAPAETKEKKTPEPPIAAAVIEPPVAEHVPMFVAPAPRNRPTIPPVADLSVPFWSPAEIAGTKSIEERLADAVTPSKMSTEPELPAPPPAVPLWSKDEIDGKEASPSVKPAVVKTAEAAPAPTAAEPKKRRRKADALAKELDGD
jgi:hypothetical protein